jgi:hypothetical protein
MSRSPPPLMTTFRLATASDDATLRAILRENAMSTWVDMAVEREPSFFEGRNLFGREWAVIAEEQGNVVGMYTAAIVPGWVDGRAEQVGYLGGLRVNRDYRARIRHLRNGYASVTRMAPERGTVPWWFTVIASENQAARRLLEAGVRGLPVYHPRGDYLTFAIPAARGRRHGLWRRASGDDVARIVRTHNEHAARFQCAPVLDENFVRRLGVERFFLHERGVAALWDQRAFKQVVARRYRAPLGALVPWYNTWARLTRRIPLPRQGGALDQTFLAFLALGECDPRRALEDLLSHCETPAAAIGLHASNPLVETVERFRPLRYPTRIYAVTFDGTMPPNGRPMQPEAALL